MTQHKSPNAGFYDDAATDAMSAAFVMAMKTLAAQQAQGCDGRAEAILRRRVADAVLDLAGDGVDCETMAHGAVDRIIAASRFRAA